MKNAAKILAESLKLQKLGKERINLISKKQLKKDQILQTFLATEQIFYSDINN